LLALKGEGKFKLAEKPRKELIAKGIVLQGILMASMSHLHKAIVACKAGRTGSANGAPHDVDYAWGLYASSISKGPIRLAEKRAPQFGVVKTQSGSEFAAGTSKVNVRLLKLFRELQVSAQTGDCNATKSKATQAISLMQVPVIQGMLREAYESDAKKVGEHQGADGFIEIVEGWAFARAVLPAIHKCSPQAAKLIVDNMDTIALGAAGPHVKDGHLAVKLAVETTYKCLGISCLDVNAMLNPHKTGKYLWSACADNALPTMPPPVSLEPVSASPLEMASSWSLMIATVMACRKLI